MSCLAFLSDGDGVAVAALAGLFATVLGGTWVQNRKTRRVAATAATDVREQVDKVQIELSNNGGSTALDKIQLTIEREVAELRTHVDRRLDAQDRSLADVRDRVTRVEGAAGIPPHGGPPPASSLFIRPSPPNKKEP